MCVSHYTPTNIFMLGIHSLISMPVDRHQPSTNLKMYVKFTWELHMDIKYDILMSALAFDSVN